MTRYRNTVGHRKKQRLPSADLKTPLAPKEILPKKGRGRTIPIKKHAPIPPKQRDESMQDTRFVVPPTFSPPVPRADPFCPLFPPRRGIAADVAAPRSRTVFLPLLPAPLPAMAALSVWRRRGTPARSLRRFPNYFMRFFAACQSPAPYRSSLLLGLTIFLQSRSPRSRPSTSISAVATLVA